MGSYYRVEYMTLSTRTDPLVRNSSPEDELVRLEESGRKIVDSRNRKEEAAKAKAKIASLNYRKKSDRARVALHLTRWSNMTDRILFLSLMMLLVFATTFVAVFSQSIGVAVAAVALTGGLGLALAPIARAKVKKALREEKRWIDSRPFEVTCYPDILVYRSYPSAWLSVVFEGEGPPREMVRNILSGYGLKVQEDPTDERPYRFEVSKKGASKFDGQRRWLVDWVHSALDGALPALHQKYPIALVEFGSGNRELDFAWWE